MAGYNYQGPIDCTTPLDLSSLANKTAIVTGGATGLGAAYVRALSSAGIHVVIGDLNTEAGNALAASLPSPALFVKTDVTDWSSQLSLFTSAIAFSPTGKIHHVVANAGTISKDTVFSVVPKTEDPPSKPSLQTIEVNLVGSLYTTKLATHYFVQQNGTTPSPQQEDTCLVLIGSGAAFLDCNRSPQYAATKYAARGIMHSLRRTAYHYGSRVNVISPWYVRTGILTDEQFSAVEDLGVVLATVEEAQHALLRIVSDPSVNGRSLFVSGKKYAEVGYVDLDIDEYKAHGGNPLIEQIEFDQMLGGEAEKGLFLN